MPVIHHPRVHEVRKGVCVLYERDSGQIRHMHFTIVTEGGHDPSEAEVETMARDALARRGKTHAHLIALHAPYESVDTFRRYKVDPAKKALVEFPPPPGPHRGE